MTVAYPKKLNNSLGEREILQQIVSDRKIHLTIFREKSPNSLAGWITVKTIGVLPLILYNDKMIHQAVKVRIYPNKEQSAILAQNFGCARWYSPRSEGLFCMVILI